MADRGKVTILDIAKEAGVSFRTVSKVVNKQPGVGPQKRAEIEAIIAAKGFRPSAAARALSTARSNLLALILQEDHQRYAIMDLQFGAAEAALCAGRHLIIEARTRDGETLEAEAFAQRLARLGVDGAIIASPASDDAALLDALEAHAIPFVLVSPTQATDDRPAVWVDEVAAAGDMVAHLARLGHARIAFVEDPDEPQASAVRRRGYAEGLRRAGLPLRPEWILRPPRGGNPGGAAIERLLDAPTAPSAVFAATDEVAFGALAACVRLGVAVPSQLSVAGFNDSPSAHRVWPALTTVHHPTQALGEAAVGRLLDHLAGRAPAHAPLPYQIVPRASVGPPAPTASAAWRRERGARRP